MTPHYKRMNYIWWLPYMTIYITLTLVFDTSNFFSFFLAVLISLLIADRLCGSLFFTQAEYDERHKNDSN